jgi:hypothetical protein
MSLVAMQEAIGTASSCVAIFLQTNETDWVLVVVGQRTSFSLLSADQLDEQIQY